jgi:hypothetical protein
LQTPPNKINISVHAAKLSWNDYFDENLFGDENFRGKSIFRLNTMNNQTTNKVPTLQSVFSFSRKLLFSNEWQCKRMEFICSFTLGMQLFSHENLSGRKKRELVSILTYGRNKLQMIQSMLSKGLDCVRLSLFDCSKSYHNKSSMLTGTSPWFHQKQSFGCSSRVRHAQMNFPSRNINLLIVWNFSGLRTHSAGKSLKITLTIFWLECGCFSCITESPLMDPNLSLFLDLFQLSVSCVSSLSNSFHLFRFSFGFKMFS